MENKLKISALTLFLFALSIIQLSPTIVRVQAQELPVPREEAVIFEGDHEYTVYDSFNPFIPQGVQWYAGFQQVVMEYDWYVNLATGEVIMWRITGWEYKDNYTTFILHVRPGVKWSDGTPYTAHDIVFTINMLLSHPTLSGAPAAINEVKSAEARDDLTAVISLKYSNPRYHNRFRFWGGPYIVPKHVWENVDPLTFKNNPPVTTGPYVLDRVIPELFMFIWKRNENYWAKDVFGLFPAPKYMIWRTAPSLDKDFVDLVKGATDAPPRIFTWPMIKQAAAVTENIAWASFLDACAYSWGINCKKYPLSLPEVRQAISLAINREKYEDPTWWFSSEGTKSCKYMFSDLPVFDKYTIYPEFNTPFEYNIAKAKQILDNLGFIDRDGDGIRETPNGTKLSFTVIGNPPTQITHPATIITPDIAAGLREIGIEVRMVYYTPVIGEQRDFGDFDISDWCTPCCDPAFTGDLFYQFYYFHSRFDRPLGERSAGNDLRWTNPELDDIIDELATLSPEDPRAIELTRRAYEIQRGELPFIPIVEAIYTMVYSTKYWEGWPSKENMYQVPYTWWPTTLFIVLNLKPITAPPTYIYVTVYAKTSISAFTGVDGNKYGPYKEGEAMTIPKDDAERLIAEGLATYTPPVPAEIAEALSDLLERASRLENTVSTSTSTLSASISDLKSSIDALSNQIVSTMTAFIGIGVITITLVIITMVMVMRKK